MANMLCFLCLFSVCVLYQWRHFLFISSQSDVNELRIAYKPPPVDSDQVRNFEIEMQIVDNEGLVSDPFLFYIIVNPMNTMAPVVTRNTGQLLYQVIHMIPQWLPVL